MSRRSTGREAEAGSTRIRPVRFMSRSFNFGCGFLIAFPVFFRWLTLRKPGEAVLLALGGAAVVGFVFALLGNRLFRDD